MASQLVRCPTCKRHIYESESSCPFCARQGNASPGILAAALSAGLAVAGCGGSEVPARPPVEIAPSPDDPGPGQPGPPKEIAEDPKVDPAQDPSQPVIPAAPAYGAPPPDAPKAVTPPAAAYGAPPPMAPSPKPR